MHTRSSTRYGAILLSRQAIRPNGNTAWVKGCLAAIRWLRDHEMGLVSSVGMQTWNLVTSLASLHSLPVRIVLPVREISESVIHDCLTQFSLEKARTQFHLPDTDCIEQVNDFRQARDLKVISEADLLLPVSVRPNGSMERMIESAGESGKEILDSFKCRYDGRSQSAIVSIDQPLNPDIVTFGNRYLFHWTRGINTAWPGERMIDLYHDLVASSQWPRDGYQTLQRILGMRKFLSNGDKVQGKVPVVSFSGLPPADTVPLMKWRARYQQMSFEPYAIGIKRELADRLGIAPVRYYDRSENHPPEDDNQWRWQSIGHRTDWRQEDEFRHRGDFDFSGVACEDLMLICLNQAQADQLQRSFPFPVTPMTI